jgi:hypothetical protein
MNTQLIKTLAQIIKSLSQEERNLLENELKTQDDWETIKQRIVKRTQIRKQEFEKPKSELSIDDIFEQMREERSEQLIQACFPNIYNKDKNDQ